MEILEMEIVCALGSLIYLDYLGKEVNTNPHNAIFEAIGYTFNDGRLVTRALRHASSLRSSPETHNETLEFLGDRVLGLVIASTIFQNSPNVGDISLLYNKLVCHETCWCVAQALKLDQWIKAEINLEKPNTRAKKTILADACEALLGAIYLDGGFEVAFHIIQRLWKPYIQEFSQHTPSRLQDPKSLLQQWSQKYYATLPHYTLVKQTGHDHAPLFMVRVSIGGVGETFGEGTSQKEAQKHAAQAFLEKHNINPSLNTSTIAI